MPRLRNVHSGAVVSVDDETAAQLGREWELAEVPDAPAKAAPRRRAPKTIEE